MPESLVVTGVGMHTPVGTSAQQTSAALRAGLSRLRSWSYYGFAGEPLVVGAVAACDRDAAWIEKVLPILTPALYEALWQAGLYDHTYHQRRVGLFMATPSPTRTGVHPELFTELTECLGDL